MPRLSLPTLPIASVLLCLAVSSPAHASDDGNTAQAQALPAPATTLPPATAPEGKPFRTPAVTGTVLLHAQFPSAKVRPRDVYVWLPPSYAAHPERRYPVLYMHDGQCLFDPSSSLSHAEWGIDESMTQLIGDGLLSEAIIVGMANTGMTRSEEYVPQKALEGIVGTGNAMEERLRQDLAKIGTDLSKVKPASNAYLSFIVGELKPFIDSTYRTRPGREDTLVAGSSLGGLISLYAICEYPDTFGSAACISTHWTIGDGMMLDYLRRHGLPDARTHRIYFDFGTETLDAPYEGYQRQADELMRKAGYSDGANWVSLKFQGANHSEGAWQLRAPVYLKFLLGRHATP
jgi:predicted alpha/beta superfamily hydrolase